MSSVLVVDDSPSVRALLKDYLVGQGMSVDSAANGGEAHVTAGFGAGADDYVVKPFRREDLVARVRRMLERTYGKDAVPSAAPSAAPRLDARPRS